jgi:hypothetical protein
MTEKLKLIEEGKPAVRDEHSELFFLDSAKCERGGKLLLFHSVKLGSK